MTVEFTGERSYEDYLQAHRLTFRKGSTLKSVAQTAIALGVLAAPVTAVGYAMAGFWPSVSDFLRSYIDTLVFMVPASAVMVGVLWFLTRGVAKPFFEDEGSLPTRFSIDEDGFSWRNDSPTASRRWHPSMDFLESDRLLVIRRSHILLLVIPKGQLDQEQLRELHEIFERAGIRKAGQAFAAVAGGQ